MASIQQQFDGYTAYKKQSDKATLATGSGASLLPLNGGMGKLSKKTVNSGQVRRDGMSVRGRHGTQATAGSYPSELALTQFDEIMMAVMRASAWNNGVAITQATSGMATATISVSGSTVTASAGSFITAGARMFETHVWTVGLAAADLGKPLTVVGMTATSITYAQALTTVAGPVATWSMSAKGHNLINPASPVEAYYTVEQYLATVDQSTVFPRCKWGGFDLSMQPNGMLMFTPKWVGTGEVIAEATASSPYFTTPALPSSTATPLAAIDCTAVLSDLGIILDLTAFTLSVDLGLVAPEVAGSDFSPDVFSGAMKISGSITTMVENLVPFADFLNEAVLSLHLLAQVPNSSPIDFLAFALPNMTLSQADISDFNKDAGPMTQTLGFSADVVGVDQRGGAYDATMIRIQRST